MDVTVRAAELVIDAGTDKKECYIAAGRGYVQQPTDEMKNDSILTDYGSVPADETAEQGMLFENCYVRYASDNEVLNPGTPLVYLARPWRWWGKHVFVGTTFSPDVRQPDTPFSLGLTKGKTAPWAEVIK